MAVGFSQYTLDGNCAVGVIYGYYEKVFGVTPEVEEGGAGLFCAGFINTEVCEKVYKELQTQYKIILRTKPRMNDNSGNMYCFVVYDRHWENFTPDMNDKKGWPF